ncbi:MAG TPA: TIGR03761 family integrating conjugative element protein [Gammaproteobacteria bacterium]|jgi:integrating conjugative element protein (TIGR03761 family)|nr:TIGR03761 family integrating conjugative element protein [Gammaproteobacteria bacterium]
MNQIDKAMEDNAQQIDGSEKIILDDDKGEINKFIKKHHSSVLIKNVSFVLHSSIARYYFFKGSVKDNSSVLYFAKQVGKIWQAAKRDDPYADLFLLRIYDALSQTKKEIREKIKHYDEYIKKEIKFVWHMQLNKEPQPIKLYFDLSYGYMAANLISDFDELVCLLYSARKLGITFDQSVGDLVAQSGNKIKEAFEWANKWQKTEVTREDVRQQNEKAKLAYEQMGAVHEQILSCQLRAPYAPKIIT